jgi:hypothetical protein
LYFAIYVEGIETSAGFHHLGANPEQQQILEHGTAELGLAIQKETTLTYGEQDRETPD